jgi:hypothetical protein
LLLSFRIAAVTTDWSVVTCSLSIPMKFGPAVKRSSAASSSNKQLGTCALFKAAVWLCQSVCVGTGDTILSPQPIQNTVEYRTVDLKPTTSPSIPIARGRCRTGTTSLRLIDGCKSGPMMREAISRLHTIAGRSNVVSNASPTSALQCKQCLLMNLS